MDDIGNLGNLLIVDDNEDILLAAKLLLKQHADSVQTEKDPNLIPSLLKNNSFDVILLDMNFTQDVTSGSEGFYWLDRILEIDSSAVVILITAFGDIELAVRAIKAGATDFVLKPWQNEKLLATLSAAMNLRHSRLEIDRLRSQQDQLSADIDSRYHDMIGVCTSMKKVFSTIEKVAPTEANVLISGENGTGKELVARALHRGSARSEMIFMSVDMGAIPESLFESELFGYEKGAFTDAKQSKPGRFEVASGGTLFLDEIGNIPLSLQAKLLKVLESREVTRVGSTKTVPFDVRLICATNMPIYEMLARSEFRQDLLYRINTVEIELPPLSERLEDISLLANHFVAQYSRKYKKNVLNLNAAALQKLTAYQWPGNIRELKHAVERAVIMTDSETLTPIDFVFTERTDFQQDIALDDFNLENVEKTIIRKALTKNGGNVSKAAQELGLTRTSLYRRMEKYGL